MEGRLSSGVVMFCEAEDSDELIILRAYEEMFLPGVLKNKKHFLLGPSR